MAKANGPLAYARLIQQSADISPVHFAYFVNYLHNALESAYQNREAELQRKLAMDINHLVNPHFEKRMIEELYFLANEASSRMDGSKGPISKINYRDLLHEHHLEEARKQHPLPNTPQS